MKQLSTSALPDISDLNVLKPGTHNTTLPEKVLQFGTGVLLRGLPDYFIDKANREGLFNGRIVVVKSTGSGSSDAFDQQNGLYTLCIRGIEAGRPVSENIINGSISRVIDANSNWQQVLACAANPGLKVIISNTTEVGIATSYDNLHDAPPLSFPGKLLAFLYERFKLFEASLKHGFVVIPTELIPQNGEQLRTVLVELANHNGLEPKFIDWLINANQFCNSLVDRIVPGKLPENMQQQLQHELGYSDKLMIMCEPYNLWAIETADPQVKEALSFERANEGVKLVPNLTEYRELKLRLLNGTHSFSCALAYLYGYRTVVEAMKDASFSTFVEELMIKEIVPCIVHNGMSENAALAFAKTTIDRFRNPHIQHQWISISVQYTSKMLMRNILLIVKYFDIFGTVPQRMTKGFAAYIRFMRSNRIDGKYYGHFQGNRYPIEDIHAEYFSDIWQPHNANTVHAVLSNTRLWNVDLSSLTGFVQAIEKEIDLLNATDHAHANIS